jgi:hypothetical protein
LARPASADDIDGNSVSSKSSGVKGAHIVIDRNIRPVAPQNAAGVFFDFAKGGDAHPGPLKAQGVSAYPAKQI